jgi:hypothetical protein
VAPGDNLQAVNAWDNNYCGTAYGYSSQTINVSLNSGGVSGNNFLTFSPSNPQVAHLISAAVIQLTACKADTYGYVSLAGGQNANCSYDYETPAAGGGYCADVGSALFTTAIVTGNKLLIQNTSGTFYNNGDIFDLVLTISGNGTYWGGAAPVVSHYPTGNTTYCAADASGGTALAPVFAVTTPTTPGAGHNPAGCGAVAAANQWTVLSTAAGAGFTGIDGSNVLEVNMPLVVFDPAVVSDGGQASVTVSLVRRPCGTVFTGTRVIAEYVDTCPAAAPATNLLFPYATPLNDSSWWFGMSFNNPIVPPAAGVAGTYTITIYEDDGDVFQYTSPTTLAAGDMVTMSNVDLLALTWTTVSNAGGGTAGDTRCHIRVDCGWAGATGFGMTGNGSDSTGYVAIGNSAIWVY